MVMGASNSKSNPNSNNLAKEYISKWLQLQYLTCVLLALNYSVTLKAL